MGAPDLDGLVFVFILGFISIPFAIWKWIEIFVWIFRHVHFG